MKTAPALTLLCMVMALPTLAFSASSAPIAPPAPDKFAQMDTNKDRAVSWEEFRVTYPQMQQAAFDGIDANKDKSINREEWDAFLAQHSMGRANTPGGMSGGMGGGMGMPPKAKSDMKGEGGPPPMITPPAK